MNKQELIEVVVDLPVDCSGYKPKIDQLTTLELIKLLDEPETGHADEAPRYVKNILARLRELPLHDREVWLKAIMSEFEQDFSHAKWREGYEQGKVEGVLEREKVTIPQFVANWIEYCKFTHVDLEDVVGNNKELGAVEGGTEDSNVRLVTMDHPLVQTARDIGICLGD